MSVDYKCDICNKKIVNDRVVMRYKKIQDICSDCAAGIDMVIALAKVGPIFSQIKSLYLEVFEQRHNNLRGKNDLGKR